MRYFLLFLTCLTALASYAKDGYHIVVNVQNNQSPKAYLAFYYAKQGNILKKDSAEYNADKKQFVFHSDKKITGGIYLFVFKDQTGNMEFILDNGFDIEINFDKEKIIESATFKNSKENNQFYEYQKFTESVAPKFGTLNDALKTAKTDKDSTAIYNKLKALGQDMIDFRASFAKRYPDAITSKIFNCMWEPVAPPAPKDEEIPGNFKWNYLKQHYWDKFVWGDDRMINIPMYDKKLEDYFRLVVSTPDSFNYEADLILEKQKDAREMFKYSLWWLTRYAESSKVMGMDEGFVYLVENYYMKGKAFWLADSMVEKYVKRAKQIAPNMIGNQAPILKVPDIEGNVMSFNDEFPLHEYTVVIFWSSDCGHCKKEIPRIDSALRPLMKKVSLKIIGFHTENIGEKWRTFNRENHLDSDLWRHVHDPNRVSNYNNYYDVRATPQVYLIDKSGKIVGKRLDHLNIVQLIEFLEKKRLKKGSTE
jgi:thiol-disulfide isomerase/thioredoxin